jgi:hypothetical protein
VCEKWGRIWSLAGPSATTTRRTLCNAALLIPPAGEVVRVGDVVDLAVNLDLDADAEVSPVNELVRRGHVARATTALPVTLATRSCA